MFSHGLHNLSETVREKNQTLNKFVSLIKVALIKNKKKKTFL